jgi:hypothetical protein
MPVVVQPQKRKERPNSISCLLSSRQYNLILLQFTFFEMFVGDQDEQMRRIYIQHEAALKRIRTTANENAFVTPGVSSRRVVLF